MINFPLPSPSAAAAAKAPLSPAHNDHIESGVPADEPIPFDSFLDTNQKAADPAPQRQSDQPKQQDTTTSSTEASDSNSGTVKSVRHLRRLKVEKKSEADDSATASDSTEAPTTAPAKNEQADPSMADVNPKPTTSPSDEQVAMALSLGSQSAVPVPEAKTTLTTPSGPLLDPKPLSTPVQGESFISRNPESVAAATEGKSTENSGFEVVPTLSNQLPQSSGNVGSQPSTGIPQNAGNFKSVTVTPSSPQQSSVIPGAALPTANGAQPVAENSEANMGSGMVQSLVQAGVIAGNLREKRLTETAKNAGSGSDLTAGAGKTRAEGAQSPLGAEGKTFSSTDGTSNAMQQGVMTDSKAHPPIKAEPLSPKGNPDSVAAVDSAVASNVGKKSADSFGQQKGGDQTAAPAQDMSVFQVPASKGELDSVASASASQTPPTGAAQHAEAVVKQVLDSAARMSSDGQRNVELQVKLTDGTQIAIKLQLVDGRIQPTFKTDSLELRQAIEQNWSQFSSGSTARTGQITPPIFETPNAHSGMNDFSQQQGGRQQPQEAWMGENTPQFGQFSQGNRRQGETAGQPTGTPAAQPAAAPAPAAPRVAQTAGLDLYA